MAGIAQKLGVHSIRPTLPESFVEQYGYNIRQAAFQSYASSQGMRELTCFVEGPTAAHRDPTTYPGGSEPSRLFAHLYEPIWNPDGSVNQNNYYAYYFYRLLPIYGDNVRFWEIVNEPDFRYGTGLDAWLTRPPTPDEVPNLRAPIFHYIRMLRISYEILKKYRPDAYVTTGGIGYPQFLDALLRYTDNPDGGKVTAEYPNKGGAYLDAISFHSYPSYSLHTWDTSLNGFRYSRTSDLATDQLLKERQAMVDVLNRYGYNGTTYPVKHLLISETNIGRRTSDDRTGTDEMQRNYTIKVLVQAQKNGIRQLYLYQLGESVNAPAPGVSVSGSDELALMGLYENLLRDAPGAQRVTQQGQALATTSKLLYGWSYDAARTTALALPAGIQGAAFGKAGAYTYVLWAKALTDNSEVATATYSFPAAWNLTSLERYEWDYAATSAKTSLASQNITLTSSPSFFTAASSTTPTPPIPPTTPPTPLAPDGGCAGTGSLLREQWDNVAGVDLASIPTTRAPTSSAPLTQFEHQTPAGGSTRYAARLRAYICPPQSGSYTFWLAADDAGQLLLSSDEEPSHKQPIASCSGWTSGVHDFGRYASQQSAPVQLVAGRRYYIEALHKQEWGPGYLAVAWRRPDGSRQEPIPDSALIPFGTTTPTITQPTVPAPVPPTTPVTSQKARITFTFAAPVANATARVAPTLYNKSRVLNFEEDDSPVAAYTDLYPLLKGGTRNGQRYPGLRFTDGTGRNRAYTAAVAINGHNTYNNSVWLDAGPNHDKSRLLWAQAQELLDNGWDIENHSDLHTGDNPAQQLATLDALIAQRLRGYKPGVHIVPSNSGGYPTAAFAAGYSAVSSNSQSDKLPMLPLYNANRVALSALPAANTPFVYNRYQADALGSESNPALLNRLKTLSNDLMAPGSTSSEVYLQRVFTHGLDFNVLADWLTYTQSIAQDRLWVTTLREFAEYRLVSSQVVKTEALSGKTLTVDLDYSQVGATTRFQNLTLLVDSPGTVTSITVTGADSATYNMNTKMVNVFRGPLAATTPSPPVPTPPTTPLAPDGGCAGTGSLLREQWDNVAGADLASIPTTKAPTSSAPLTQFEHQTPAGGSTRYAARLRAYICPPQSGSYTFWLAADDAGELLLSSDEEPSHKQRIASCSGWTSGVHDFGRYASQQSAPVQLVAGRRYYIEALHKQEWGPGYLAVAWRRPDGSRQEPIPGSALIPFTPDLQGRGFASSTASGSDTALSETVAGARTQVIVAPNPLGSQDSRASIEFRTAQPGTATVSLFNAQGQLVRQLFAGALEAGLPRTVDLDPEGLNNGLYFVRLVTATEVVNQRLVISR